MRRRCRGAVRRLSAWLLLGLALISGCGNGDLVFPGEFMPTVTPGGPTNTPGGPTTPPATPIPTATSPLLGL